MDCKVQMVMKMSQRKKAEPNVGDSTETATKQNLKMTSRLRRPLQRLAKAMVTNKKKGGSRAFVQIPADPLLARGQSTTLPTGRTVHGVGTASEDAVFLDLTRGGPKKTETSARTECQRSA